MTENPAVFVSHGPPTIVAGDMPAAAFLRTLGDLVPRPRAIVVASAHWETANPAVSTAVRPHTIHDFFGFEESLYRMNYPAPGAPEVAEWAAELLEAAGMTVVRDPDRGFDHGVWTPLMLAYAQADVPVVSLALQPALGPAHHFALGRALGPLCAEGVLVMGSGGATHDLPEWRRFRGPSTPPTFVTEFNDWLHVQVTAGDVDALIDYRRLAPAAVRNHPTEEHLLPLFVAMAAGGGAGRRLHASISDGVLAMDAYAFASPSESLMTSR